MNSHKLYSLFSNAVHCFDIVCIIWNKILFKPNMLDCSHKIIAIRRSNVWPGRIETDWHRRALTPIKTQDGERENMKRKLNKWHCSKILYTVLVAIFTLEEITGVMLYETLRNDIRIVPQHRRNTFACPGLRLGSNTTTCDPYEYSTVLSKLKK